MPDVNERTTSLLTAVEKASTALRDLSDDQREAARDGVDLLERVVAYAELVLRNTDGDLIPDSALSQIEARAASIESDAGSAAASARANADDLLAHIALLPAARDRDVEQSAKEAAANFQRSASHRLNALEREIEAKSAEIDEALKEQRTSVDETLINKTNEIETQTAAFAAKLTEFEATLTSQRQAISDALERQSKSFTQTQEEQAEQFQVEIDAAKKDLTKFLKEAQQEVSERVTEIRRMEDESSGLVHSTAVGLTAERYGEEADKQRRVANVFRANTLALALGAVAVAIWAVVHEAGDTSQVVAKLGVSLVFGALATYTARQSGSHRRREEFARARQLELTAFAPFIEPLDDDLKELERILMARKTFGGGSGTGGADDDHRYGLGPIVETLQARIAKRLARSDEADTT